MPPSFIDRFKEISPYGYLRLFGVSLLATLRPDFWGSTTRALKAGGSKSKTAYLDGLRGFAALMIYAQHNTDYAHQASRDIINHAWGWNGNYAFTMTPIIKVFFHSGNLAVMLFFAISGYVTSVSLLKLLHAQDTSKLAHRLGCAIPQRFVRLWAPACAVSFTFMLSWHVFGIIPDGPHHDPAPSLAIELPRWVGNFFFKSYIFNRTAMAPDDLYDPHLWYIPLQFQASVISYIIFLCMLSFNGYPASVRIWTMIAVTIYFGCFVDSYFCALSTFGMLLCDFDLLSDKNILPAPFSRCKVPQWLWYIPLAIGLFVSTCPSERTAQGIRDGGPGWYYLSFLKPAASSVGAHWFNAMAGALVLLAIPRIRWLKVFFELPLLRDLGKITYMFYLVQGPILWTIGARIYAAVGRTRVRSAETVPGWINIFPLPDWGPLDLEINFLLPHLILLPLMVWVASIATKVFEAPSGRLAQWLFNPDRYQAQLHSHSQDMESTRLLELPK